MPCEIIRGPQSEVYIELDCLAPRSGEHFNERTGKGRILTSSYNVYQRSKDGRLLTHRALDKNGKDESGFVKATLYGINSRGDFRPELYSEGGLISISDQVNYRGQIFQVKFENLLAEVVCIGGRDKEERVTWLERIKWFEDGKLEVAVCS